MSPQWETNTGVESECDTDSIDKNHQRTAAEAVTNLYSLYPRGDILIVIALDKKLSRLVDKNVIEDKLEFRRTDQWYQSHIIFDINSSSFAFVF